MRGEKTNEESLNTNECKTKNSIVGEILKMNNAPGDIDLYIYATELNC